MSIPGPVDRQVDRQHAIGAADRIGRAARAVDPADFAPRVDLVVAAVAWDGLQAAPVVAICGDQPEAFARVETLIQDLGGRAAVVGGLASARQLEEAAGFVMRTVASGHNPRFAVPNVDPALLHTARTTN